jgi:REP element-mobilizing transposase RayT
MPNHFHFLVKIRETEDTFTGKGSKKAFDPYKSPFQYFSDLFNAYTKSVNKWYNRTGSLFEHPFRRKKITDLDYFRQLVLYIHNNPVHHGFTEKAMDYPWSSYLTLLSVARTNLERDKVMGWFDSEANFRLQHQSVEKEIPKDWSVFESKP